MAGSRKPGPPAQRRRAAASPPAPAATPALRIAAARAEPVGRVTHYWPRAGAATLVLTGDIAVGDTVHVRGHTTDDLLRVERLRRAGRRVKRAAAGDEITLGVGVRVRAGDRVYRVVP